MHFICKVFLFCVVFSTTYSLNISKKEAEENVRTLERLVPELSGPPNKGWHGRMKKIANAIESDKKLSKQERKDRKMFKSFAVGTSGFNCPIKTSNSVPTSVHKLRPSDVKAVAAIGDSLTAANGALAKTILGLLIEYRGYAFTMGGQLDLSQQVTMPNILKKFNSKLKGHSTGNGIYTSPYAKLNLAEPGNVASDLPRQANNLVARMKSSDSGIDFKNDWKVITLFIGGNDLCTYCNDKKAFSVANYKKYIQQALDILHNEVPRAFVNVLETVDATIVNELKDGTSTCRMLLTGALCKCIAAPSNKAALDEIRGVVKGYQEAVRDLVNSGRYDTKNDFTVVVQPFLRNSEPPRKSGKYDLSFFAPDCFHFSAKGHAEAGRALWNNMIEPVGKKSTSWSINQSIKCPTDSRPYLSTRKN